MGTNEFFNSEITKASIKITSDESNGDDETIHLVLKSPVSKGLIRLMHKMARPFVKETIFYKRGLPYLARYHPVIKTLVPECLLATVNVENSYRHGQLHCLSVACFPLRKAEDGIIILEDLTQQRGGDNYSLFDKGAILTYDQVKVALESLAHFHGAWWQALHGKGGVQPKEASADLTAKDLKDLYGDKLPRVVVKDFISSTLMSMAQLMENSGRDPAAAARLRRFGQSNADDGATAHIFALTQDSKFKTIIHGDFWSNNIMFHYDKEGKPDKVRFFDFQLMAMVHPVQDIWYVLLSICNLQFQYPFYSYFLYINTDKCFREKYLDLCLRSYYAVLQNYLIGQEFSYNMFKKEFDEHRLGGMLFGLMVRSA